MPVILDVGAKDGTFALAAASDPNNQVYAFEHDPAMLEVLIAKAAHVPNCTVIPKMVGGWSDGDNVICLEEFIKTHGITEVEYLHTDVDGRDMDILVGLGDCLRKVKAGVVCFPSAPDRKQYPHQHFVAEDAMRYLANYGCAIARITPIDSFNNQINIHFKRS